MGAESVRDDIIQYRKAMAESDEPVQTVKRNVRDRGNDIVHNIPSPARSILDIHADTEVEIEIYLDRYVVRPVIEEGRS